MRRDRRAPEDKEGHAGGSSQKATSPLQQQDGSQFTTSGDQPPREGSAATSGVPRWAPVVAAEG